MKFLLVVCLALVATTTVFAKPSKEAAKETEKSEPIEEADATLNDDVHPEVISKSQDVEESKILPKGLKIAEIEEEFAPVQAPEPKVSYEGSQLLRVVLDTKEKKKLIGKLRDAHDISMWGGNQSAVDILVCQTSKDNVLKSLASNTVNYEVVIENIQTAINEENPVREEDDELENRQVRKVIEKNLLTSLLGLTGIENALDLWPTATSGHQMEWTSYHPLHDIHSYLDYLGKTYSNLVSTQVIGTSHNGRPLKLVKISNGKPGNKAIFIDGGMHAREWISPASVTYIINDLVLNFDALPKSLQHLDWYILPVANPDGYEYSRDTDRLWRKNRAYNGQCQGTDLNRNFGYKWGGRGSGHSPCQEIYAGTGPFSEPETNAIRNFISHTRANWQGYVSFHSYGQYILYPWGYDKVVTTDYAELTNVGRAAAQAIIAAGGPSYTVGPSGSTLYPASGGSDDWAKGAIKMKYAYTIELRDTGRYGFLLPAKFIKPTANEALAALHVIAKAVAVA